MRAEHPGRRDGQLYLNGSLQGTVLGIHEPFTWNVSQATIRLG